MTAHLIWWQWVGIAWIVLGVILGVVFVIKSDLLRETPLRSMALGGLLIVTAPYWYFYDVGICCQALWRGRIPIYNDVWWPGRAAKFIKTKSGLRRSREAALVQMIELRRRCNPRLRNSKHADQWPMFQLLETPEAFILARIEDFRWLIDSGLTEQSAMERLERSAGAGVSTSLDDNFSLRDYIAKRLKISDPPYQTLSAAILVEQTEIADKWVRAEIQSSKSQPTFPPKEWLKKRISVEDIDSPEEGNRVDWDRLKTRLIEHDELWEFSSPSHYWEGLAGRAGIALIRDRRSIAHVITEKN